MISFGPRSILLLIGTAHGLVLAALLLRASTNRTANRLLAVLLCVVALRVVPYIIGFAGFYDAFPWLSYLPYDWSLGYGALVWLYACAICRGSLPAHWRWHLAPAALQGAYYTAMFVQPLAFKNVWNETMHDPLVLPIETAWSMLAMMTYLLFAWREYTRYQRWLDADLSNREEFRLSWLRAFLLAFAVTLVFWSGTALFDVLVRSLTYFDRFPLYLWFSVLIYGLGVGGLRSARLTYPRASVETDGVVAEQSDGLAIPEAEVLTGAAGAPRQTDWAELGGRWSERVRGEGWWRDANLTAPILARHLTTNTSYLSRALNEGLGQNFNEFVNRLRVEAVQAELTRSDENRDILAIALDAGFNSKASFNRVFKRLTGETPTDFRRRHAQSTSQIP